MYLANDCKCLEALLFLEWHKISKVLHHAHNVGVTGVLVLSVEKPLPEGLIVSHYIALVHSDLDMAVDMGGKVREGCKWFVEKLGQWVVLSYAILLLLNTQIRVKIDDFCS